MLSVPLGVALATAMGRAATLRVWSAAAAAVAGLLRVPAMPLAQILVPLLLPVPLIIPLAGALRAAGFAAHGDRSAPFAVAVAALPVLLFGGFWVGTRLALMR